MKANELRIGNWVNGSYGGFSKDVQVYAFDHVDIQHSNEHVNPLPITAFKPIPLTEEWLLKFGFVNNGQNIYDKEGWLPYLRERKFSDITYYQVFNVADCAVVYVHQLQNLYFALTGEELTINKI